MTDLTMYRGDDREIEVAALQPDGTAQDLTNVTLWFTAKRHLADTDEDADIAKTTADGITITDAAAGLAEVVIDAEDTDEFPATAVLHWDLQGRDAEGRIRTLATGRLLVLADVTRDTDLLAS